MLLGHSDEPGVASDNENHAGRRSGCQAVQGGLQISLVSSEVCKHEDPTQAWILTANSPLNDMILDACIEISSHPSFSRRMVSGSFELAVDGSMGFPVGPNPNIYAMG